MAALDYSRLFAMHTIPPEAPRVDLYTPLAGIADTGPARAGLLKRVIRGAAAQDRSGLIVRRVRGLATAAKLSGTAPLVRDVSGTAPLVRDANLFQ